MKYYILSTTASHDEDGRTVSFSASLSMSDTPESEFHDNEQGTYFSVEAYKDIDTIINILEEYSFLDDYELEIHESVTENDKKRLELKELYFPPITDELFKSFLHGVENGALEIMYDSWSFSGGRDWGDWHGYTVYKEGDEVGSVNVSAGYPNRVEIRVEGLYDKTFEGAEYCKAINKVLMNALKRDDPEFVEACKNTFGGEFGLPADNFDISREDIISGRYADEILL